MPGWHHRGYLPHLDYAHLCQAVTFRLADAMPGPVITHWLALLAHLPEADRQRVLRTRIDAYEDAGKGACLLSDPACAGIVQERLLQGDGTDYRLHAWAIMPNHVHVLVGPLEDGARLDLSAILKGWKGGSAHAINRRRGQVGTVWQRESYDRWIRDPEHFVNARNYIEANPMRAGLCTRDAEWRWSSAGARAVGMGETIAPAG